MHTKLHKIIARSARAVEYTGCISSEGQNPSLNECPVYDTKQSDGEVLVMMELWGMGSTPSSFPGPLEPGVVAPDRVLSMGQIELNHGFESLLFLHLNGVFILNWIV